MYETIGAEVEAKKFMVAKWTGWGVEPDSLAKKTLLKKDQGADSAWRFEEDASNVELVTKVFKVSEKDAFDQAIKDGVSE